MTLPLAAARCQGAACLSGRRPQRSPTHLFKRSNHSKTPGASSSAPSRGGTVIRAAAGEAGLPSQGPAAEQSDREEKQRRKQLWVAAIKAPMYSVGFIPVLVRAGRRAGGQANHTKAPG